MKSKEKRGIMSVGEYIKMKERRRNFPGRLVGGEMFVFCCGEWMRAKEFNELFPKVIVPNFSGSMENPNRTEIWMYQ